MKKVFSSLQARCLIAATICCVAHTGIANMLARNDSDGRIVAIVYGAPSGMYGQDDRDYYDKPASGTSQRSHLSDNPGYSEYTPPTPTPEPEPPPEPTPEPALDNTPVPKDYIYDSVIPECNLDYDLLDDVNDMGSAVAAVEQAVGTIKKGVPEHVDELTLFAETAIAYASTVSVDTEDINLSGYNLNELAKSAGDTKAAVLRVLDDSTIPHSRDIRSTIRIKTNAQDKLSVTYSGEIAQLGADIISVDSPVSGIKVSADMLKESTDNYPLVITVEPASDAGAFTGLEEPDTLAAYSLSEHKQRVTSTKPMNGNVTVTTPMKSGYSDKTSTVKKEDGTNAGGKYNPATKGYEYRPVGNGTYSLVENKKDFADIENKSKEMQEAIKYLAVKGVTEGMQGTQFLPDSSVTRAQFALFIMKVLAKYDPNAASSFSDVRQGDWMYGVSGSSKRYGIISGYDDNTFRGNRLITNDQIAAVMARTLVAENKFRYSENADQYLAKFKDRESIPEWSKSSVALITKINLMLMRGDGRFLPRAEMTRGDAAIIIKRMIDRVW